MRSRRSSQLAVAVVIGGVVELAGCLGNDLPEQPIRTPMEAARVAWEQSAWPALSRCVGCHGNQPAIDFLSPSTMDGAYETVFAFQPPIVDIESPSGSLLVTMGKHTGPAFEAREVQSMLAWLEAEREARLPDAPGDAAYVGPFTPSPSQVVTLELPGTTGAQLRLRPIASAGVAFSNIELVAGSKTALRAAHPVFVAHPDGAEQIVDELDRFDEVDVDVPANTVVDLGGTIFLGFSPNTALTVHFATLEEP